MPKFSYKARDSKGLLVTGEVDAETGEALQESLSQRGFIPLGVHEVKAGGFSLDAIENWWNGVKQEEIMVFTRQFYTLFRAGVSIDTILATLAKQGMGKLMRQAIDGIRSEVSSGSSLSQSFRKYPLVFNELYCSMMAAGEEAGILEQSLAELVKLIEKEESIKRNIKSATLYPKIVVGVMILSVGVLMTFVVPKFEVFFAHYKAELPLPTRLLMGISHFVRDYWWLTGLMIGTAIFLFHRYASTRSGKFQIDQLRYSVPVFGDLNLKVANARFGHILSALYKSGLPMARSLEVVANVIDNEAFAMEVRQICVDIRRGSGLANSMQQRRYFPVVVIETTAVGERAGSLDEMLSAVAEHFDLEVAHTIKNLTTLLEPLMLVGIFGMVTLMALAIFLPIWSMSSVVNGGT